MNDNDRRPLQAARWIAVIDGNDGNLEARPLLDSPEPARIVKGADFSVPGAVVIASAANEEAVEIERTLAPAGSALAKVYRLACRHDIDPLYPDEVHAEVEALVKKPGLDDPTLVDLENLPFVTIDNADSRDLDQALYIERTESGTTVYYALADAAYYVRPGTALFDEALKRGSSYYLPGLAIPMLPRALSEGLISLNEDQVRRALVFVMQLDHDAICRSAEFFQARIRSRRKLSYRRVQRAWHDPWGSSFKGEEFAESLELLREVGDLRIADAHHRHVVDYNRVELHVRPKGQGWVVETRHRLHVERCNEQISLMCNIEGAKLLADGRGLEHVQPIFRVHPKPGPERLGELRSRISDIVQLHGLDKDRWTWKEEQRLDDYLDALSNKIRPRITEAIQRQAILTNQRSLFGAEPGAHHGIGAPVYARFSSPMREIVGIFTHKEALEMIRRAGSSDPTEVDLELRERVVKKGNFSKALQRTLEKESTLLVLNRLFEGELDLDTDKRPIRRGTVLGMKPHLVYIRLDNPQVEVKLHLKDLQRLTGEQWRTDRQLVVAKPPRESKTPPLRMGGLVKVRLAGYDKKRRRWLFEPVR